MTKAKLAWIAVELDSIQCPVELIMRKDGVVQIKAKNEADRLIAKAELLKAGFTIAMSLLEHTAELQRMQAR